MGDRLSCCIAADTLARKGLQWQIWQFAEGAIGPNTVTIGCADLSALEEAQCSPERHDLVRTCMDGRSEFFVAVFPHRQEQHKRCPTFEAAGDPDRTTAEVQTAWRGLARRGTK